MTDSGQSRIDLFSGFPVQGKLLADRLAESAISPREAVHYAIEIGSALHRAHTEGRIHGALTPQSVVLVSGGGISLLRPPAEPADTAAHYQSPEQVQGGLADARSDVFAFGTLLYEMVSGRRAFTAPSDGSGAPIHDSAPPALKSREPVVLAMESAIAGCLEKDPEKRRQRIKNVVADLKLARSAQARSIGVRRAPDPNAGGEIPLASPVQPGMVRQLLPAQRPVAAQPLYVEAASVTGLRKRTLLIIAAAVGLMAAVGVATALLLPSHSSAAPGYRLAMNLDNVRFAGTPVISPDGGTIAYTATGAEGKRMLWVRAMDETHARPLPSTEGAFAPFWSPDSKSIAFFANESLKKVSAELSDPPKPVETICPVEALPGGGSWSQDGTILFAPGLSTGLFRVAAGGGKPQAVTQLDPGQAERQHLWPQFLPDGKRFLFFVRSEFDEKSGVFTGALDVRRHDRLFAADSNAIFVSKPGGSAPEDGFLLFIRERSLVGQPFNAAKMAVGDQPVREVVSDVGAVESLSLAQVSASKTGVLIYQSVGKGTRHLVWMNRTGETLGELGEPGDWGPPRISPDGKRVIIGRRDASSDNAHVWLLDAEGHAAQVTNGADTSEVSPVWSPDGGRIAYATLQPREFDIFEKPATLEGKAELLNKSNNIRHLEEWSHDGRFLLFSEVHPDTRVDLMAMTVADRKISSILDTVHSEGYPALSADSRWLAYQSDESGGHEVYVQPFENGTPGTKRLYPISKGGGALPRWRKDGGELYYLSPDGRLMAVTVHPNGAEFAFDAPHPLFQTRPVPKTWNLFDVAADGQRFLMNLPMEWPNASPITVTTSWAKDLTPAPSK